MITSPRRVSPPRPTGHLSEQLEGSLPRSKIGHIQRSIGLNDTDKGDSGIIMSLGHHLCPHQDIDFAFGKAAQDPAMGPTAPGRVSVHPGNSAHGESFFQQILHPLRADSRVSRYIPEQSGQISGDRLRWLQ